MKKTFLLVMVCLWTAASVVAWADTSAEIEINNGPYIQSLCEDSVTVVWMTNKKAVSNVHWGIDDVAENVTFNSEHGLIDAYTKLHTVRIDGLTAGTNYQYRVYSREIKEFDPYEITYGDSTYSEVYNFTTLDRSKEQFSFYEMRDIHEDSERLDKMLERISWDEIDLVFYNGDMIDYFETENQIFDSFIDVSVKHFASEIPFVLVRGNHEARGKLARDLINYFPSENNKFYLSFNHGPVHFIVLDLGEDKADSNIEYGSLVDFADYRDQQLRWFRKNAQTEAFRDAKYRVIIMHIPPYVPGGTDVAEYRFYTQKLIARHWLPVFNETGIDFMMCGHYHENDRIVDVNEIGNHFPIMIGSQYSATRVDVCEEQLQITVRKDSQITNELTIKPSKN